VSELEDEIAHLRDLDLRGQGSVVYAERCPSTIGPITLEVKQTGERSAGNPKLRSTWRGLETRHGGGA
jgi:hypothetical protein